MGSRMKRKRISISGHWISYFDNCRDGEVLVCLHGHFGCASMFAFLEEQFQGRLILIDQRGHGESDRTLTYAIADYVADLSAVLAAEQVSHPFILGHYLGGIVAMHYAAEHANCRALIIEDIGTEVDCSNEFIREIPPEASSLFEMQQAFRRQGMDLDAYFMESLRYDGAKWRFRFGHDDMIESQRQMNGNHWAAWNALTCPVLILHGSNSWACSTENLRRMAACKQDVQLVIYDGAGHTLRDFDRKRYVKDVGGFISSVLEMEESIGGKAFCC